MVDFGISDDFLKGYNDRLQSIPFDNTQSDDWQMGWNNAEQKLKRKFHIHDENTQKEKYYSSGWSLKWARNTIEYLDRSDEVLQLIKKAKESLDDTDFELFVKTVKAYLDVCLYDLQKAYDIEDGKFHK